MWGTGNHLKIMILLYDWDLQENVVAWNDGVQCSCQLDQDTPFHSPKLIPTHSRSHSVFCYHRAEGPSEIEGMFMLPEF